MKSTGLPSFVVIAILTAITAVFWIGFEIFRSFTVKPSPPVDEAIIAALNPTLDAEALSALQQRLELTESEIGAGVIVIPTQTPAPEEGTEELVATAEGELVSPPPATEAGGIVP